MRSNKILVAVVVIILVIGGLLIMGNRNTTVAPEKEPPTKAPNKGGIVEGDTNGQPMQAIDVAIKNFEFTPATVTVKKGTTVTWMNQDSAAHTVTASDKSFDSGNLANGQKFTHTFNTPGTFEYVCTYHASMKAKIVVQ